MGGLGRAFDGGYAEYTCVPVGNVKSIHTSLSFESLGALPEMLQTAWGSLFRALQLKTGDRLLIRGGTTSVGMAAAAIARAHGATVASTTRQPDRQKLLDCGADHVFIDDGNIADALWRSWPLGATKVLELVGTTTLRDSLDCAGEHGIVCMTGMVGDAWSLPEFSPMDFIKTGVYLTVYSGDVEDFMATPFQTLIDQVTAGILPIKIGKVFGIDEIVEAHRTMEENRAGGKIVVLTR
jgi:NADPH:quinone reductase-like Zn-dependent oxidoreductase